MIEKKGNYDGPKNEYRYEYKYLGSKKHKVVALLLCLLGGFLGLHYFYVRKPWRGALNIYY